MVLPLTVLLCFIQYGLLCGINKELDANKLLSLFTRSMSIVYPIFRGPPCFIDQGPLSNPLIGIQAMQKLKDLILVLSPQQLIFCTENSYSILI